MSILIETIRWMKHHGVFNFIPDKLFYEIEFRVRGAGKHIDWENPTSFCEKLQWLKVYNRKEIYTILADKYKVRDFVALRIGEEHLIPLYGVYDSFDQIDFDILPDIFVMKCNHDSGSVRIVNKKNMDINELRSFFEERLKNNYFYFAGREYQYKHIPRKIIVEEFLETPDGNSIPDYKFYCFNGEPKFFNIAQVSKEDGKRRFDFYDLSFERTPFYRTDHERLGNNAIKPRHLDEMIEIAKCLSKDEPFVRVDLYEHNDVVYFSELTFYPGSGFSAFYPPEWNKVLGSWIDLSLVKGNM